MDANTSYLNDHLAKEEAKDKRLEELEKRLWNELDGLDEVPKTAFPGKYWKYQKLQEMLSEIDEEAFIDLARALQDKQLMKAGSLLYAMVSEEIYQQAKRKV